MYWYMELLIVLGALAVLALSGVAFGSDSRPGFSDLDTDLRTR